jgi:hypothetical protein
MNKRPSYHAPALRRALSSPHLVAPSAIASEGPGDEKKSGKMRARPSLTIERQAIPAGVVGTAHVPDEIDRVRLIAELTRILRDPSVPDATRRAGLTLVGWLARRMPGEPAHTLGCEQEPEVTQIRPRAQR